MAGGYLYGDSEPLESCPYCGSTCSADFVDVGVGFQQCGPYHCDECGASQIGPHDTDRELSPEELKKGWYRPGSEPGSSANVVHGHHVSHQEMRRVYREAYPDSASDTWRREIRKGK